MMVEDYLAPRTAEEALDQLARYGGDARLIAGGTDLMIWIRKRKYSPKALIDITGIEDFRRLEEGRGGLSIGAAVTHAEAALHGGIRKMAPALSEACASVGSPQIRNIATVAGNVVSAQPAADAAVALVALGARAEILSAGGVRVEPVEDLYAGAGRSRIDSTREIVRRIMLDHPGAGSGCAFMRIALRQALALPVINVAAAIYSHGGVITSARIAIGPVAGRPFRPGGAEKLLAGVSLGGRAAFFEAAEEAGRDANPRDSLLRGSAEYRRHLVKVLVRRALEAAADRIAGGEEGQA